MKLHTGLAASMLLTLTGCASGNLRSANSRPLKPPHVAHAQYDPYAAYGSAPAQWAPAVASRDGTIVKPTDPVDQADRPDYEHAAWSAQAAASKAGTF
ncbi:hypothetical protein K2X14_14110 [Acetobacter sp. TBRC 12305]|uniref:Lipoprotein n=1 Tax=Acetobacter garciniae TaxID=2817435 RepID=A0A939HKW5_9PROT|nr:hypothetical protein [Acetobacter garciniae]MBO1326293.1 hypothetical protein [Acetobacter garciniae]MBX0345968.1 hypothetical protein [Acetobacter garciniae]